MKPNLFLFKTMLFSLFIVACLLIGSCFHLSPSLFMIFVLIKSAQILHKLEILGPKYL